MAHRLALAAAATLVLAGLLTLVLPTDGPEALIRVLVAYAVVLAHLALGVPALVVALRSPRSPRHLGVLAYFGAFFAAAGALVVWTSGTGAEAARWMERVRHPAAWELGEAARGLAREAALESAPGSAPRTHDAEERRRALRRRGLAALRRGASPDRAGPGTRPPLLTLAGVGEGELVRALLAAGADVAAGAGSEQDTPLHAAAAAGHAPVVALLLEAGAHPERPGRGGETPLALAVEAGHAAVARALLAAGADPEAGGRQGPPLARAARRGDAELAALLVDAGADPGAPLVQGRNAAWIAFERGHGEVVRRLLEWGGAAAVPRLGERTRLHDAAFEGDVEILRELLDLGVDPDASDGRGGTALALLASLPPEARAAGPAAARERAARLLLERGASPDRVRADGPAPLARAVRRHPALVGPLLAAGADPDVRDAAGRPVLVAASQAGRADLVRALLRAGADPDAATAGRKATTALRAAVLAGSAPAVEALLEAGARADPATLRPWLERDARLRDPGRAAAVRRLERALEAGPGSG